MNDYCVMNEPHHLLWSFICICQRMGILEGSNTFFTTTTMSVVYRGSGFYTNTIIDTLTFLLSNTDHSPKSVLQPKGNSKIPSS